MKISIIMPVYNEENAVGDTIEKIKTVFHSLSHKFEIIAINDGSSDNTLNVLKKVCNNIITHPYNLGYGASLKDGIRQASGDWIIIIDADGTYPVEDIPKLLNFVPEYDMVVGARIGKTVHIPFLRRPAKWFIGKLANFMAGRKIADINSGFRVFNRAKALEFLKLYPSGFSFTTTITLAFLTNDYTVKYVPINYFKRIGKSTIRPIKDFIGFVTLIFRIVMYFKPLKFFVIPGLLFILVGILYGSYQFITSPAGLGEFPVLVVLIGIMTLLLGFVADMVSKK